MKRRIFLFLIICFSFIAISCGQSESGYIPEQEIVELVNQFEGDVGIYALDLESGESFEFNAETLFPTTSSIKIPIMIALFDKIDEGDLDYRQMLEYDGDHDDTWGNDLISQLKVGAEVELSILIHLMMSTSNNTASLWNQHLAGTGTRIDELMKELTCIYHTKKFE